MLFEIILKQCLKKHEENDSISFIFTLFAIVAVPRNVKQNIFQY